MKKIKALVLVFALAAALAGGFTAMNSSKAEANRCCWVMVCTISPPYYCWEMCVTCPTLP